MLSVTFGPRGLERREEGDGAFEPDDLTEDGELFTGLRGELVLDPATRAFAGEQAAFLNGLRFCGVSQ